MKVADLEDNSDLSRMAIPTARDHDRTEKYRRTLAMIRALTAENAKEYIGKQEWCLAGGGFFRERGIHKQDTPFN